MFDTFEYNNQIYLSKDFKGPAKPGPIVTILEIRNHVITNIYLQKMRIL